MLEHSAEQIAAIKLPQQGIVYQKINGVVWPSMVTHTRNLCSAFNPSKCTLTVVNTHPEQWAAIAAVPREQLGVRCLAQGSHLSRGIEGGENARCSLPPPTIPAEIRTHNLELQVRCSIH